MYEGRPSPGGRQARREASHGGADSDDRATSSPAGGPAGRPAPAPAPRLHLGRLAILVLVLIGASFYVAPLSAFFTQQDRYQHEAAALQAARADNAAYKVQVQLLSTKDYVAQRGAPRLHAGAAGHAGLRRQGPARADEAPRPSSGGTKASAGSISVLDRINDLWRTLLH